MLLASTSASMISDKSMAGKSQLMPQYFGTPGMEQVYRLEREGGRELCGIGDLEAVLIGQRALYKLCCI